VARATRLTGACVAGRHRRCSKTRMSPRAGPAGGRIVACRSVLYSGSATPRTSCGPAQPGQHRQVPHGTPASSDHRANVAELDGGLLRRQPHGPVAACPGTHPPQADFSVYSVIGATARLSPTLSLQTAAPIGYRPRAERPALRGLRVNQLCIPPRRLRAPVASCEYSQSVLEILIESCRSAQPQDCHMATSLASAAPGAVDCGLWRCFLS
jgi:hypothetical protein